MRLGPARRRDLADVEAGARHRHLLARPRGAVVQPEGDVDEQHVEAEEAEDRPGAVREEDRAGDQPAEQQRAHQHGEAGAAERAVRREQGPEERLVGRCGVCLAHGRRL